jgi:hypothetical protein
MRLSRLQGRRRRVGPLSNAQGSSESLESQRLPKLVRTELHFSGQHAGTLATDSHYGCRIVEAG